MQKKFHWGQTAFLLYFQEYDKIRHELHSLISKNNHVIANLSNKDKISCPLTLDKENTTKTVGKYTNLMFQKREKFLESACK